MFQNIISSYLIVYAIGYMLFVRPALVSRIKSTQWADKAFYVSLIILATIRFASS